MKRKDFLNVLEKVIEVVFWVFLLVPILIFFVSWWVYVWVQMIKFLLSLI